MINSLYKEFASYYVAATNFRDFTAQMDCVLNSFPPEQPCRSILELFAGQALHSVEAIKKGGIEVWAVDSSDEMKKIGIAGGFNNPDQYLLGNLPETLLSFDSSIKFDGILCLQHSLSNLTRTSIFELLHYFKKILTQNGKVFIELHNISSIMKYISNPIIHFNPVQNTSGEPFEYAWPGDTVVWNKYTYKAEVPVKFKIPTAEGTDTVEFISEEYIYSAEDIMFLAGLQGFRSSILSDQPQWDQNFDSLVLELSLEQQS